jgi:hypothetical protein
MNARQRIAALGLAISLAAGAALGAVSRQGEWPEVDPLVSLSVQALPRSEAVKLLAERAGWSIVLKAPSAEPIDVHVKDQPASKVLELLLDDGDWIAHRDGSLISIARGPAPPPAAASAPPLAEPAPPAAAASAPPTTPAESSTRREQRGDDRVVTGGKARVERGETVKDLVVMGGSAEVLGTVTGDLAIMGGSAVVRSGGKVEGDATVVGGSLEIEDGAEVAGDVGILGGRLERGTHAKVGGGVQQGKARLSFSPSGLAGRIGGAITRTALLFVFGAVLLALVTRRMESLQAEIGGRPMRSFALGIVGLLVAVVAVVALSITIIGIPIAIVAVLFGVFATYAGICAVLATTGGALVQHKTKNPYVHLAVGCAIFMLASAIPVVGGLVTLAVVMIGMGAVVSTHGAGYFLPRGRRDAGPYRTAMP